MRVLLLRIGCSNIPSGRPGNELDVVLTNGFQFCVPECIVFSVVVVEVYSYIIKLTLSNKCIKSNSLVLNLGTLSPVLRMYLDIYLVRNIKYLCFSVVALS